MFPTINNNLSNGNSPDELSFVFLISKVIDADIFGMEHASLFNTVDRQSFHYTFVIGWLIKLVTEAGIGIIALVFDDQ